LDLQYGSRRKASTKFLRLSIINAPCETRFILKKSHTIKPYAGAAVVCSLSYEPIAGHRANIPLVKYLSEGREIEIALAPIAGTRLLAPFRLSVASTLANLMIGPIDLNDYGTCSSRQPA
jgi:hypothetical protein